MSGVLRKRLTNDSDKLANCVFTCLYGQQHNTTAQPYGLDLARLGAWREELNNLIVQNERVI